MQDVLVDFMRMEDTGRHISIGLWLPYLFFEAANAKNPNVTPESTAPIKAVLDKHIIIAVVDYETGPFGGLKPTSEADLRAMTTLVDSVGNKYAPLTADDTDIDTQNFLAIVRPMMTGMLGQFGKGMHFMVFPANSDAGTPIASPLQQGRFTLAIGQRQLVWRLPCGSLLPRKHCPICSETLSGAFLFCPFDGTALPKPTDANRTGSGR